MAGTNTYINEDRPVYISYARNDANHLGWEHIADSVVKLTTFLRRNNILVRIDDSDLTNGYAITEFERDLINCEFIILFFSEKYFQSLHCMYEFSQIVKGLQSGKIKKLICVKCGDFILDDVFIEKLRKRWRDLEFNSESKTQLDIPKSDIEYAAHGNSFYKDYILRLRYFFSDKLYFDADKLDFNAIFTEIKSWSIGKTAYISEDTGGISADSSAKILKQNIEKAKKTNVFSKVLNNDPIFISYSWTDSIELEKKIEETLKQKRFAFCVDRADFLGGENIKSFEDQIGNSKYTILIYSDNYFRSAHCMHEFVKIKMSLNEKQIEKKKRLLCIKNGEFDLNDEKYIMELKNCWKNYGINVFCKEFEGIALTEIETIAKNNNYYKVDLLSLNSFFSKDKKINAKELNFDDLTHILLSWMGYGEVYLVEYNTKEYCNIHTIIAKIEKGEIKENTKIYSNELNDWREAGEMPEFEPFLIKIPPPL